MPYKDKEEERQYRREQMRQRRAQAKGKQVEGTPTLTTGVSPPPVQTTAKQPDARSQTKTKPAPATRIPEPARTTQPDEYGLGREPTEEELSQAAITAYETRKALDTIGWVAWECRYLDNDVIIIIRDESVKGYPRGYPVYTENEIKLHENLTAQEVRRLHLIKKATGGELISTQRRLI